ncbi:spermatogenesis associated 6-like protein isoform X1 [Austrofundulus limnaeus]|uniref:Spermatogenesis associated 6-like protein isoform X1 n=1 Tax=Austrofundulus limnaeus TaxID=52670 RepID=A0A2I4C980_AUSLI|nr:PREDICTED: spermatogenesis-associated protein 6-like isoform X1 [Austrofundulus limnaeus]
MTPKALKVVVEIKFRAVSCPGVRLPAKHDVYLSVCFMGQHRQSECLPAVFPLLVYEKMTFEKIFRYAVDPGDISVMLEYETLRTELVQMSPPAGEILACFEEDARSFLFSEPKIVPPLSGVDREVLMMKASHFPGICPRLEFSTKTTITECSADAHINIYPNTPMRPGIRRNRRRSSRPQTHGGRMNRGKPRSKSLSPLRHANIQNLARLSLDSAVSSPTWSPHTSEPVGGLSEDDSSISKAHNPSDYPQGLDSSELRQSYQEHAKLTRSRSLSHTAWEEVHERVRGLLTTPKAVRRLIHGATNSEVKAVLARRSIYPGPL